MLLNNRYNVIRSLGSGGFGETFIAEDTQMPSGRWCVIKKLHPISNNPQIYQLIKDRFQREAAILEDLGSQNDQIPTLYAYFVENNNFYLAQELVDGKTLSVTAQSQGIFSESYVKNFSANFLPILDYTHSKQIIHRDIKPDNIIIRQSDDRPVLI
jgi:serine/threonine-protein kinase